MMDQRRWNGGGDRERETSRSEAAAAHDRPSRMLIWLLPALAIWVIVLIVAAVLLIG